MAEVPTVKKQEVTHRRQTPKTETHSGTLVFQTAPNIWCLPIPKYRDGDLDVTELAGIKNQQ